jgi:hypothetical protein
MLSSLVLTKAASRLARDDICTLTSPIVFTGLFLVRMTVESLSLLEKSPLTVPLCVGGSWCLVLIARHLAFAPLLV